MNFHSCFIFRFRSKNAICFGPKMLCSQLNITKFCDIGTGDFRFRFSAEQGISFLLAFSFTADNEKCIVGRPLRQTISDYTLYVNGFQTFNNAGSGQPVGASKN